jgi:hypothetical protein
MESNRGRSRSRRRKSPRPKQTTTVRKKAIHTNLNACDKEADAPRLMNAGPIAAMVNTHAKRKVTPQITAMTR